MEQNKIYNFKIWLHINLYNKENILIKMADDLSASVQQEVSIYGTQLFIKTGKCVEETELCNIKNAFNAILVNLLRSDLDFSNNHTVEGLDINFIEEIINTYIEYMYLPMNVLNGVIIKL